MQNTEEKQELFKVFWSGEEVSAEYLSKYYANELDNIKEENMLLGQFNAKGKYSFSQETKKALIAIKKAVDEKVENSYYLISKTTKNSFSFKMKIIEVEDEKYLAANLYLIEAVDDERFKKPLKTFVAQYVDKKDDEFVNKAKYVFNISIDGDFLEKEKKENEEIIKPILPKTREKNQSMVELATENYLKEMLEELEYCGEEGKKILKEFFEKSGEEGKKLLNKNDKEKPNFIELKKKLDSAIENSKGFQTLVEANPEIISTIKKYNEAIENEKKISLNTELSHDELKKLKDKEDGKKEEKKATTPKKKVASPKTTSKDGKGKDSKGKSKGGDGKKPEKKEKKTDPIWKNAVKAEKIDIKLKSLEELLQGQKDLPRPSIKEKTLVTPALFKTKPEQSTEKDEQKPLNFDIFSDFVINVQEQVKPKFSKPKTEELNVEGVKEKINIEEKIEYEEFNFESKEIVKKKKEIEINFTN